MIDGRLPVVHAVTDDAVAMRDDFLERATAVMQALGARGAVHLRAPHTAAARLFALAEALAAEQARTGCTLVVNDRLDLALAAGAWGVQLTSRSLPVGDARQVAPTLPIGASIHAPEEGAAAQAEGADWVVAGHIFETTSHPGASARKPGFLSELREHCTLPCIAIGGIGPEQVSVVLQAGAYGVAAITGIWGRDDAAVAAIDYLSAYDGHTRP